MADIIQNTLRDFQNAFIQKNSAAMEQHRRLLDVSFNKILKEFVSQMFDSMEPEAIIDLFAHHMFIVDDPNKQNKTNSALLRFFETAVPICKRKQFESPDYSTFPFRLLMALNNWNPEMEILVNILSGPFADICPVFSVLSQSIGLEQDFNLAQSSEQVADLQNKNQDLQNQLSSLTNDFNGCMEEKQSLEEDLKIFTEYMPSSLHQAVGKNDFVGVRWLCERKHTPIEETDDYGNTPLLISASKGNLRIVRYFVEVAKANIHALNQSGRGVLHMAAATGQLEVAQYLIEKHKLNPESLDTEGNTCLHRAAYFGRSVDLIVYLVKKCKCNLKTKNAHGQIPYDVVCKGDTNNPNYEQIRNLLKPK